MGQIASPGVPLFHEARGDDQNRTGVDGFAGRCLATRPRRLAGASVATGRTRRRSTPRTAVVHARISDEPSSPSSTARVASARRRPPSASPPRWRSRPADAARRPRSAGLRRPLAGDRRRGRPRLERAVRRQGQARRRPTRPTRRCSGSASSPPTWRSATWRRSCSPTAAAARGSRRAGAAARARALGRHGHRRAARARRPVRRGAAGRRRRARAGRGRLPRARRAALDAGGRAGRREGPRRRLRARSPCCRRSSTAAAPRPTPWRCCRSSSATCCWRGGIPRSARFDAAALAGVPVALTRAPQRAGDRLRRGGAALAAALDGGAEEGAEGRRAGRP